MNVEVLVITLIGVVLSTDTCTYINQNKNLVAVSTLPDNSNNGNTQEYVLNVGESLSISCIDEVNTAFAYGEKTTFTCDSPSSDKENLPLCVSKCSKLVDLASDSSWDQKTKFVLSDNHAEEVTNKAIAKNTPVTIQCIDSAYAQSFEQLPNQACELWTADALCKRMCDINSYDPSNTILAGTGIQPSLANPQFLRVGFSVSISCKSGDFAQPLGAQATHSCNENHVPIEIENCHKKCRKPDAPTDTEYIATQDQLRQGQTFTVKCSGDLKFPIDQSVTEVVCRGDGTFKSPYPECKETCKISAIDEKSTKLSKEVVGGLAQKETVQVSCIDDTYLLPYGYATPWTITCGPDNLDIDVPACQQTCDIPSAPPNADLSGVAPNTRMKLREPITATCKKYYSYEEPTGTSETRTFLCSDAEGQAQVKINQFCYVYAKLDYSSAGTAKVKLEGQINDGKSYDTGNTVVNFKITGTKTDETRLAKPNEKVEVTVAEYEPLSVEVKTTSVVDGIDRVIKITQENIYPGPPSPTATQTSSTSTTASIKLAHPSNSELEKIVLDQQVSYKVQYTNKGDEVTKEIAKTDKDKEIELPNLEPASTYSVKSTVVLPDEYGGSGDPVESTVYTGPSQVDSSTINSTIEESAVSIVWAPVDNAKKYEVKLFKNGISSVTKLPTLPKVDYADFDSDTTYKLQIWAIREVDNMEFRGDMLEKQLAAPPPAPKMDEFDVTTRGDSAVIKRVPASSEEEQSTRTNMVQTDNTDYIVFYSHSGNTAQKPFPADVKELELVNLTTSSTYDIRVAQAAGSGGYGMKTFLKSFKTADCGTLPCQNCQETTQFEYVVKGKEATVKCIDGYFANKKDNTTGELKRVKEIQLLCNGHQYVYLDDQKIIVTVVECTDQEAVVDPETGTNYTMYYIIAGVGVFLVLVLLILMIIIRKRRTQGSYNAKKAKENSKNGVASPDMTSQPKTFVNDDAFFENKWDNELLRAQSGRSKATSYGSQELRMTIADSDSGITEDLENVYFNPALYSTNCEDDTVSTKSALV